MDRTRNPLAFAAAAVLLTGCFGPVATKPTRLFVLNATATPPASSEQASDLRLGISRILLPDLLNRPQIVTRTGANTVRMADFSQWAEPLESSIPRVLSENLSRLTETDQIFSYPWPTQAKIDFTVEIAITEFEGDDEGRVSLVARWRLIRPDGSELRPMQGKRYAESAADGSTEATVAAMSRALAALSRDVAAAIAAVPR